MKHTPGPWTVNLKGPVRYSVNAGDKHIALVSCWQVNPGDKEENEANATLIAAALEMYEALIKLRDDGVTIEAIDMAEKAIQKAEGE